VIVDVLRRADLHDAASVQHADLVPHRHGLDLVVGDEQERGAELHLKLLELRAQRLAKLGVEV
jgi:hypothetical protein